MNTRFRNILTVAVAALALGTGSFAVADGVAGRVADKARERGQEQRSERRSEGNRAESRPQRAEQPARSEQPARAERPARSERPSRSEPARQQPAQQAPARQAQPSREQPERVAGSRSGVAQDLVRESRGRDAARDRAAAVPQPSRQPNPVTAQPRGDRSGIARAGAERAGVERAGAGRAGSERAGVDRAGVVPRPSPRVETSPTTGPVRQANGNGRDRERGVLGNIARDQARNNDRDRSARRDWRDRDGRYHRHVHVVHRLPYGYHEHYWNGGRYYYWDGYWYRPYGSTFISVGIPYGLFVSKLPGAYTSVWIGGTRYYYSDYHYYTYEPARRGYVVVRSPYGDDYVYDDEDYVDSRLDDDLYIYPAQGQSEQQQADDRYECHRWAVSETDYDPIDDEYDADLREDYLRALTACLTGRGYTVR